MYSWWRDWSDLKVLPLGGSDLMEQPAYIIEAIRHCETIKQTVESEMHEKHEQEMKRASRRQGK